MRECVEYDREEVEEEAEHVDTRLREQWMVRGRAVWIARGGWRDEREHAEAYEV